MKKIFKILITFIIFATSIILLKNNITAVKEDKQNNDNNTVLTLDLNSDIILKLYENLNLNLINNNCELNCLKNSNYNFLYYNFTEHEKSLNDQEKLYLTFNSLYKKEQFEKTIDKDNIEILNISLEKVVDEMRAIFGNTNFENFDHNLKIDTNCGIIDYVFTGTSYELKNKPCQETREFAKVKKINSYKKDNYIFLTLKAFRVNTTKKDFNEDSEIFEIFNFNHDKAILKTSLKSINENTNEIFDKYDIKNYTFKFELDGENYYLKKILKEDN